MKKILIAVPVIQQDIKIFKEFLWSLNKLEVPKNFEIHKYFYLYNSNNIKKFLQPNEYEIFDNKLELKKTDFNYIWDQKNFDAISEIQTKMLIKAREEKYDYLFNINSNIILHKKSLIDLLLENKDIIGKIYWTSYNKEKPWEKIPNCYDGINHAHEIIYKNNLIHYKFIGTYEVGIIKGATLISSKIFNEPLINYYPIKILSSSYLEDYSFCVKCKCVLPDIKIYINTLHPAKCLNTEEDYNNWIKWEKQEWE